MPHVGRRAETWAIESRLMSPAGICHACHHKHALPPRTEPLRPHSPCARCSHGSYVLRERATMGGGDGRDHVAPLTP